MLRACTNNAALAEECARVERNAASIDAAARASAVDTVNGMWVTVLDLTEAASAAERRASHASGDWAEAGAYKTAVTAQLRKIILRSCFQAQLALEGGAAECHQEFMRDVAEARAIIRAYEEAERSALAVTVHCERAVLSARVRVIFAACDAQALRAAFVLGACEADATGAAALDAGHAAIEAAFYALGVLKKMQHEPGPLGCLSDFAASVAAADCLAASAPPPQRTTVEFGAGGLPLSGVARAALEAEQLALSHEREWSRPSWIGAKHVTTQLRRYSAYTEGFFYAALDASLLSFLDGGAMRKPVCIRAPLGDSLAAAQARRAERQAAHFGRLALLRQTERMDREFYALKRFVDFEITPKPLYLVARAAVESAGIPFVTFGVPKRCEFSGGEANQCHCPASACGSRLCTLTRQVRSYCDCGSGRCGGGLCMYTDINEPLCFCGEPRCGSAIREWTSAIVPMQLAPRGEWKELLCKYSGRDGVSLDVHKTLREDTFVALLELRYPASEPRLQRAHSALLALAAGNPNVFALVHATGKDSIVARILREGFRLPQPLPGGLEDISGVGCWGTAQPDVAERFRSKAALKYTKFGSKGRTQRCAVLCIADMRDLEVLTTHDPAFANWPRDHDAPAGTTDALKARGFGARQYVGALGHEFCNFYPERMIPVAVLLFPKT